MRMLLYGLPCRPLTSAKRDAGESQLILPLTRAFDVRNRHQDDGAKGSPNGPPKYQHADSNLHHDQHSSSSQLISFLI
jgi:hypothetical protein